MNQDFSILYKRASEKIANEYRTKEYRNMSHIIQQWQNIAYDETADRSQLEKILGNIFPD